MQSIPEFFFNSTHVDEKYEGRMGGVIQLFVLMGQVRDIKKKNRVEWVEEKQR